MTVNQCKRLSLDNNEGGDGLTLSYETQVKPESFNKIFNKLKVNVFQPQVF